LFQNNVWSRIIDPAFHDVKFELVRSEGMSFISNDRKNDRTGKGDGIFRITDRKWVELNGTKYFKDSCKLLNIKWGKSIANDYYGHSERIYCICHVKRGKFYEINGRLTKSQPLAFVIDCEDFRINNLFNDDTTTMIQQ